MITLRPYQVSARDAVRQHWQAGNRAALVVLPTGTGKTEVILSVLESELGAPNFRALIIAHRQELIYQPRDRAAKNWPRLPGVGVVMAGEDDYTAQIVCATVQTLAASGRLERILSAGSITHAVIDEAHHTPARTYQDALEKLWRANPGMRLLGVTATPKRTDKLGLSRTYGRRPVYRVTLKDAIKAGALCPFRAIGVELPVSAAGVRLVGSNGDADYDQEAMGAVMDVQNARQIIVETWVREASDRPTMVFTSSVAQAHHLAADFRAAGYAFEAVDGTTPVVERQQIIADLLQNKLQGVVNCQVFTEGFDAPHLACVVMAKPTRSDLVYLQCVGRGLRTHPSKADCLILDFAPYDARDLIMAGDLVGKPKAEKKAEEKAREKGVILSSFGVGSDGAGIDGDPDAVKLRMLNLLSSSPYQWTYGQDVASVTLGMDYAGAVVLPQHARAEVAAQKRAELGPAWRPEWDAAAARLLQYQAFGLVKDAGTYHIKALGVFESWDDAHSKVEEWGEIVGDNLFAKKDKRWRNQPAQEKQVRYARQLGITVDAKMTRGRVAQAITHALVMRSLRAARVVT